MTENPIQKEKIDPRSEGSSRESINTSSDHSEEKQPISSFGTKKKYRYPLIKLYLDEKREKVLKDCCGYCGIDPSRVDDHQQDVIWEILGFMEPVLKFRNKAKDAARAIGLKPEDLR
jgi:hypothetical protein